MPHTEPLARGLWGVLATPFTEGALAVDDASLRRHVAQRHQAGSTGLVVREATGAGIVVRDYPVASKVSISSAALLPLPHAHTAHVQSKGVH